MSNYPVLKAREERNGWPAFQRPDLQAPDGWSPGLITSIGRPRSHTLSPDGEQVAFFWDQADTSDLYLVSTASGWPRRLTFDRAPLPYWFDEPPQWSPDGAWLAFTDGDQVWVVPAGGGTPRRIGDGAITSSAPRWLADSYHLVAAVERGAGAQLVLVDREGGWLRPVTPPGGRDHSPQVSPDGRAVVFVHQMLDDLNRADILVAGLEDSAVHALAQTPGRKNRSPCWSPDGRQIAYTSERPGFYELFVFDMERGQEWQASQEGCDLDGLAWFPDGQRVACTLNRGGAFELGWIDLHSGRAEVLRRGPGFHARPQVLPDGGGLTFEYDDPRSPADIYRLDLASGAVTQLTYSTPPALAGLERVQPEALCYPSLDGLGIPAFLYRPARPNGAAIVYPHGGPTAQHALEWDAWAQYMAAKGYLVLAPNFRGSTGYGMAFERANYGTWGVGDVQDCLAGADLLVNRCGAQPGRIAILGASYGGYLAVCALAFDPRHRFACGVTKYGDCNLLTSWAACDHSGHEDLYRMLGHPAVQRAAYRAGSPVLQVEAIQAPLLILHGLLDPYVSPWQSEELVEALRKAGKTYEYKTYPDEGHGILRRKNQLDYYERMERFIDWYLL